MSTLQRDNDMVVSGTLPANDAALNPAATGRRFAAVLHTALEPVEQTWRGLEHDGVLTAYQRFDWVASIARHLAVAEEAQLLIVELRDPVTARPAMLWPLMLRRRRGHTAIEWLSCGVCDYAAPVMARGLALSYDEANAAWTDVLAVLPRADLVDITGIRADIAGRFNPLARLAPIVVSPHSTSGMPILGEPETLLERACKPSFVKELRSKQKRLAKKGEIRFVAPETVEEADALFDILLEQRLARFRKLGRFDLLTQPAAVAFYRDATRDGLMGGPMRIFGLKAGDDWIASCTGLIHGGAFHGSLLAIGDDAFRNLSPGLQLIAQTMVWSREQGLDYFDFTVGALSYKSEIGAKSQPLFAIKQALTLKGWLVVRTLQAAASAKAWLEARPELFDRLRAGRQWLRIVAHK